jgi:hypothetical protein
MSDNPSKAEAVARRAVELSIKVFGKDHLVTATAMLEQAAALRKLGRKGPARDLEKLAKASLRNNTATSLSGYTVNLHDFAGAKTRQMSTALGG